ncbi:hypothetical protein FQH74_23070 [Escherichia coli]|nr:hypothetical protein [Escherichia coli]
MGKLKTKNLKESEFIKYIETHLLLLAQVQLQVWMSQQPVREVMARISGFGFVYNPTPVFYP